MMKMAKKEGRSTRALTGPRTLVKLIPPLQASYTVSNIWEVDDQVTMFSGTQAGSWQVLGSLPSSLFFETYLDLSAYELDDLTIYPLFIGLQDPGLYSLTDGAQTRMRVVDIMSQERLDPLTVVDEMMFMNSLPGMSPTDTEFIQILSGQYRMMLANTTYAAPEILQTVQTGEFGSGSPSSVQKLWLYRFVVPSGVPAETSVLTVPGSRFVMRANIVKEKDLSYLMRQKRSYELAR